MPSTAQWVKLTSIRVHTTNSGRRVQSSERRNAYSRWSVSPARKTTAVQMASPYTVAVMNIPTGSENSCRFLIRGTTLQFEDDFIRYLHPQIEEGEP